jgi:hypothetical protein
MAFLQQIPKDTEIELARIRFLGRPKVTKVQVGDLRLTNERFGVVNLKAPSAKEGRWELFHVDLRGSPASVREPEVLPQIAKAIQKFNQERQAKGTP